MCVCVSAMPPNFGGVHTQDCGCSTTVFPYPHPHAGILDAPLMQDLCCTSQAPAPALKASESLRVFKHRRSLSNGQGGESRGRARVYV